MEPACPIRSSYREDKETRHNAKPGSLDGKALNGDFRQRDRAICSVKSARRSLAFSIRQQKQSLLLAAHTMRSVNFAMRLAFPMLLQREGALLFAGRKGRFPG